MDPPVDLVIFAAGPGIFLLTYAEFSPWFFPGGLAIVITGVLRLAYSGAFGVAENGSLAGLSIHFTPLVVTGLFLLDGPLSHNAFAAVLYAVIVTSAILQVAPLRMDKLTGPWVFMVNA